MTTEAGNNSLHVRLRGYQTTTTNGGPAFLPWTLPWTISSRKVLVHNGRQRQNNDHWQLNKHSFQLVHHEPTRLSYTDFIHNTDKIRCEYHDEMKRVIQKYTGATAVVVFHHKVRSAAMTQDGHEATTRYAHAIHTDASALTAERAYFGALKKLAEEWPGDPNVARFRSGRFMYINAWRNISDDFPIMDNHLACCDESSLIAPDDYILSTNQMDHQGNPKQRYLLSPRRYHLHRWYYFPRMTKSEILLFKQWDSDDTCPARMCFHTAFHDPTALRRTTPARESIEVRAIAFFPNHQPNTCPVWNPPAGAQILSNTTISTKLLRAMEHVEFWPLPAQQLVRMVPRTRQGAIIVLEAMMRDGQNRLGLQTATPEAKVSIKADILSTDLFFDAFLQAKNKLA